MNDNPYGYTARWSGGYTHLLHLRARWYSPETGTFLSVDPVESEPPYQYVRENPATLVDPSGMAPNDLNDCLKCDFDSEGYAEGYSSAFSYLLHTSVKDGGEAVYDFATMERASFKYKDEPLFILKEPDGSEYAPTGYSMSPLEGIGVAYAVRLFGFESTDGVEKDYSGRFEGFSIGANTPVIEIGPGDMAVWSHKGDDGFTGELEVWGIGTYMMVGIGVDLPVFVSASVVGTNYRVEEVKQYKSKSPLGDFVPKE